MALRQLIEGGVRASLESCGAVARRTSRRSGGWSAAEAELAGPLKERVDRGSAA